MQIRFEQSWNFLCKLLYAEKNLLKIKPKHICNTYRKAFLTYFCRFRSVSKSLSLPFFMCRQSIACLLFACIYHRRIYVALPTLARCMQLRECMCNVWLCMYSFIHLACIVYALHINIFFPFVSLYCCQTVHFTNRRSSITNQFLHETPHTLWCEYRQRNVHIVYGWSWITFE